MFREGEKHANAGRLQTPGHVLQEVLCVTLSTEASAADFPLVRTPYPLHRLENSTFMLCHTLAKNIYIYIPLRKFM